MAEELALVNLKNCLVNKENYTKQIEDAKSSIAHNNKTIEDFNELIKLQQQSKTSIATRYAEKITEILSEIPNDIKITLSNNLYGNINRANLTLDFMGKRFFLLYKGIAITDNTAKEEHTVETFASNMARSMAKDINSIAFSSDIDDLNDIYSEYQRNTSDVTKILIDRELGKQHKALLTEISDLSQKIRFCEIDIRDLTNELATIKKSGFIEKLFSISYVIGAKKHLETLNNNLVELNAKLNKAKKDEADFIANLPNEKEKTTKKVTSSIEALSKFMSVTEMLTGLKTEFEETYVAPIAELELRKSVFVKQNEELSTLVNHLQEQYSIIEKDIKLALKEVYENKELTKEILSASTDIEIDEETAKAIKYVKANYKKELSSKITSILD